MNRPIITIVRGLPGSGKSTYARELSARTGASLIEPDALLVSGGVYQYKKKMYDLAVWNARKIAMDLVIFGADVIFADVLPTLDDVGYILRGFEHACLYRGDAFVFAVIDMPLLTVAESIARNRHNVRAEDIAKMAAAWEPWEASK